MLLLESYNSKVLHGTSCCCSVSKSCLTLCVPMDCSMPSFPVLHYLLESAQTHAQWVGDAIQPSHLLLSPSPPALILSQHQGFFPISQLFTSGSQSIEASTSASVLPMYMQGGSPLGLTGLTSLQSKGLSRVLSSTTQLFGAQPSLRSKSHIHTWLLEKPEPWLDRPLLAKWCLCFYYAF